MQPIQLIIKDRLPSTLQGCIKIMNPESTEKNTTRLAVTKTAMAAFIYRINTTQKITRVRKILLRPIRILTPILLSNIHLTEEEQHAI